MMKKLWQMISVKLSIYIVLLGALIIGSGCVAGYINYTRVIEKMYNDKAYSIAYTAMEKIDGNLIEEYYRRIRSAKDAEETKTVSQEIQSEQAYQDILKELTILREKMEANYIYMGDLSDERGNVGSDIEYMMDVDNPNDQFPAFVPGDKGKINKDFLEDARYIYDTGKRSDNYFYSHSAFGYNTSAIVAIRNDENKTVALLGVELAMTTLQRARKDFLFSMIFVGVILTAVIVAAFFYYIRKTMIVPIEIIKEEAESFIKNETTISKRLKEISTGDEIQSLSESLYQMQNDIISYIDNLTAVTAEKERISAELNVATQIQADMLPNIFPPFPSRTEIDIIASMEPAKEVGGDFYDFFLIDENHLALVIADVSGKGVPAALFMVISKTLLKNQALMGLSPKEILMSVNNQLCENNEADMFVTVWLGILDLNTGVLTASNAGHEYPAICRDGGSFELLKDKHGFVLAGMEDVPYQEYEIKLEPGDTLFVYTDGVAEATNHENELYGTDRMLAALNQDSKASPQRLLTVVREEIDAFVGSAEQFDDITMLSLRYHGKGGEQNENVTNKDSGYGGELGGSVEVSQ
ncbi:MAG: PP2C family protein-serine/threonine phosphatase [Eubacteriales bacterium]|nr:PP2C family protein-serine/threonine phosphatase [Eubacteriales bacterium]